MTEPEVPGSDPTTLRTRAVRDGDDWVIDGHKWFSSGAEGAAFGIVMAVTDPDAARTRARRRSSSRPTRRASRSCSRCVMGHAGKGWSTHCEVRYTNVRVPVTNTLGAEGAGFLIAQKRLGPGRIHHVMRWLGQMQRAFELMCQYSLERETSTGPLADKQTIQNWIADSYAEIQACRFMTLDAAHKIDARRRGARRGLGDQVLRRAGAERRDRPRCSGARRARADRRDAAREHADARPRRPHLRRPRRGAPPGGRKTHPESVCKRRRVAVQLAMDSLQGKLLVSSPSLLDPNFRKTVVLVAHHDDDGAMGLVLSRPSEVRRRVAVPLLEGFPAPTTRYSWAAPFSPRRSWCSPSSKTSTTPPRRSSEDVGFMPADTEPDDLSIRRLRLFAGYSGWGAGQLEAELEEPSWIVVDAETDDAFADDPDQLWRTCCTARAARSR